MAKIHKLSQEEAQKIAAGEVVERPANVVKELIENALDADADTITMYIEDGGKQLIHIIDNGSGMSPEDARLCIQHHTTSKITSVNDLEILTTFGFRGEAISSIASVSNMRLTTRDASHDEGFQIDVTAGKITDERITGCNIGTELHIEDLFYNLPARKKFLKKRETEWRAIQTMVTAFALKYPTCHFTVYHDGKQVLHCPRAKTLLSRMHHLFDQNLAQNARECHYEDTYCAISGAITMPHYSRYDRSHIFLFVNNRWIKNYKLSQAIVRGYSNVLPPQRYPAACIFITVDPAHVDINVHPRKEEVQFLHPRIIERAVQAMVKERLQTFVNEQFSSPSETSRTTHASDTPRTSAQHASASFSPKPYISHHESDQYNSHYTAQNSSSHSESDHSADSTPYSPQPEAAHTPKSSAHDTTTQQESNQYVQQSTQNTEHQYRLIGQYNSTYILIENDEGLTLIDQHAAHERILYERFAKRLEEMATTKLLFPQLVSLSPRDYETIMPHLDVFSECGITIEDFGSYQLTIHALPVHIKNINGTAFVHEIIGWIHEHDAIDSELFYKKLHDYVQATMACKAAVKAGDTLTDTEMHHLIATLYTTPNRLTCPHGRPTIWPISLGHIEKQFKRKL
jgi:DNA mismatch repair protein MutL